MFQNQNLFKGKYRIDSARLQGWDYSNDGYYYVTICTRDRIHYFGEIINNKMIPNKYGVMAKNFWQKIPNHFNNTRLDQFVIMPNHIHGIIIIENTPDKYNNRRDVACNVSTNQKFSQISPKFNSLSTIIRSFKSAATKKIHEYDLTFAWQYRFYDRIIRNEKELYNVRQYIINNPQKWELDKNNLKNIFGKKKNTA